MTRESLTELLGALCRANGISGDETEAADLACSYLKAYCPDAHIVHGNVVGTRGGATVLSAPHVLLDAHIDQVGLIVTSVTENGFLTVGNIGGLDRRLLPDQHVQVHGVKTLDGILCCMPPHLTNGEEKVQKIEEVRIDTGYPAEELRKLVYPGDSVTFCGVTGTLPGGRFTSPALDDRCGVAAILYALDLLQAEELPCHLTVQFSTQEEVGERGAKIGCFAADPEIALAIDVSFAGDGKDGTGKMGAGAMIGVSPSLSRKVSRDLMQAADEEEIPWQYEVMAGTTGTNADQFSVCRAGVRACTVSIPLDYMHTPAEVIDITDVMHTGELLAAYLRRCIVC
ncbi:MAG: M20/M25/M40 family metallo-hydrolase [Oscillospiraceae bacterium]|nr:M20/M25/M40 family metallo-hydrolase [Oscillospiraceae bacterium]